jgi:hypothetical protein
MNTVRRSNHVHFSKIGEKPPAACRNRRPGAHKTYASTAISVVARVVPPSLYEIWPK